jgi:hypothetical protein
MMFIVKGKITIDPSVTSISGIFFSNGQFLTGTAGPNVDERLNISGSVVALDGVILQRDLPNEAGGDLDTPAEYFEYRPDLLLSIPYDFGLRLLKWKEVAPGN